MLVSIGVEVAAVASSLAVPANSTSAPLPPRDGADAERIWLSLAVVVIEVEVDVGVTSALVSARGSGSSARSFSSSGCSRASEISCGDSNSTAVSSRFESFELRLIGLAVTFFSAASKGAEIEFMSEGEQLCFAARALNCGSMQVTTSFNEPAPPEGEDDDDEDAVVGVDLLGEEGRGCRTGVLFGCCSGCVFGAVIGCRLALVSATNLNVSLSIFAE
ncbi:MAG: hypothetical protein P4L61_02000 [Candidatus Pacebacteria bacterium]|nr:hypothetical protein [Candidatus Paceibacterota bacterium]